MKTTFTMRHCIMLLLMLTTFAACEKNLSYTGDEIPVSGNKATTNLSGLVTDETGTPMSGVQVKVEDYATTTNAFGIYIFESINVNKVRFVITAKHGGYFDAIKSVYFIKESGSHFGNLQMLTKNLAGNFMSQNGGNVTLGNGSGISFPPDAFVDGSGNPYSGNVKVYATHINEDTPDFLNKIPGGDLRATDASGNDKILETYGMMKTVLEGSAGQLLNLAPLKKATISFPIAAAQMSQASATIPLWYFDEKTALWLEEGSAVKSGNIYQGDVAHFTWWNCDFPVEMCTINGIVVDCEGVPLSNITISFLGIYTLTTNSQGQYSAMWPFSQPLTAQVLANMNSGIAGNSNVIQAGPFTTGSNNTLPNLVVPCTNSRIQGYLKDCNGNNVSGFIVITGTQYPTSFYCSNGEINAQVLPSTPINIIAYVRNVSGSTSVISGAPGQPVNIGDLVVCDVAQRTTVVLNGDGYNNQVFEVDTTSTNSIFSPSGPTTALIVSGLTVPQNKLCLLQIDFCGNHTGNYPLGPTPNCNSDISMILDGVSYYPDDANSSSDFISVVEYGVIGENIIGTFFTHLQRIDPIVGTIPITMSGTFIVPRRQ